MDTARAVAKLSQLLDEARVEALHLRNEFPQLEREHQMLDCKRHMSLFLTDIENALIRLWYVGDVVQDIPMK